MHLGTVQGWPFWKKKKNIFSSRDWKGAHCMSTSGSFIKGIKRSEGCQWHRFRPLRMAGWLEAQICFGDVIPNRIWPGPGGVSWQNNAIQTLEVQASYRLGQQGSWCTLCGSCLESLREANDTKGHFGEPTYVQRGDFLSPALKGKMQSSWAPG